MSWQYDPGYYVRLVQNHMLTGQVVGERNWGLEYEVRLGATVSRMWFCAEELEPDPDFPRPAAAAPAAAPAAGDGTVDDGNVIDFNAAVAAREGELK